MENIDEVMKKIESTFKKHGYEEVFRKIRLAIVLDYGSHGWYQVEYVEKALEKFRKRGKITFTYEEFESELPFF